MKRIDIKNVNEQPIYSNYKRNAKFLGIIDYKSLIVIVVYAMIILNFVKITPFNMYIKLCTFLFFVIPILAVFTININNDSTVEMLLNVIKFMLNKKCFVNLENVRFNKKIKFYS